MKLYYKIQNTIIKFLNNLHSRCQRFVRGWADEDVWDMDVWFVKTVEPMLKQLRDRGYTPPEEIYDEAVDVIKPLDEIITEMARCVHLMNKENAKMALAIKDGQISARELELLNNLMEKNKKRFFELFSEYFWELWC